MTCNSCLREDSEVDMSGLRLSVFLPEARGRWKTFSPATMTCRPYLRQKVVTYGQRRYQGNRISEGIVGQRARDLTDTQNTKQVFAAFAFACTQYH